MSAPSFDGSLSGGGGSYTSTSTKPGGFAYGQFSSGAGTPLTGSDSTQGYSVGSFWYDPVTKTFWVCVDATAGAAVWKELLVSDSAPGAALTEFYSDVNGTSATTVDAYSYTVPASTLTANGESIRAVYAGTVNMARIVSVAVQFAGTEIFWSDEVSTIADWRLDVDIVRTGSTTARCSTLWTYNGTSATDYATVSTGLDFATGEILKLRLYAEDTGTDVTARFGKIWKMGAA